MSRFSNTLLGTPTTVVIKQEPTPTSPLVISPPKLQFNTKMIKDIQTAKLTDDKFSASGKGTQMCSVNITCENTNKLKNEIERMITDIKSVNERATTNLENELENFKRTLALEDLPKNIDALRTISTNYSNIKSTTDKERKEYKSTNQHIPAKIFVMQDKTDSIDGLITEINIGTKKVKIEYKFADKLLRDEFEIDKICIGNENTFCGVQHRIQ